MLPLAVLGLVLAGGTAVGAIRAATPVQAQTTAQTSQAAPDKETPDSAGETKSSEPANEQAQEKNLPGGGHQDTGTTTDHQFDGVE